MGYDVPELAVEFSVSDLFSRIPDLHMDYANVSDSVKYADVQDLTYSKEEGFRAKVREKQFAAFKATYEGYGYTVNRDGDWSILSCDHGTLTKEAPMFIHTYIQKMFERIPSLYLAEPFPGGARYSQMSITYMVAYVLGMLVRYYPTHWITLIQGDKGDAMWPTINRAQQFVETSYPELVAEMIGDIIKEADAKTTAQSEKP